MNAAMHTLKKSIQKLNTLPPSPVISHSVWLKLSVHKKCIKTSKRNKKNPNLHFHQEEKAITEGKKRSG